MLMPKRVKYRSVFRGNMRGTTKGGATVEFGEYRSTSYLKHHGSQTVKLKQLVLQ